jgi:hypothetical protein
MDVLHLQQFNTEFDFVGQKSLVVTSEPVFQFPQLSVQELTYSIGMNLPKDHIQQILQTFLLVPAGEIGFAAEKPLPFL